METLIKTLQLILSLSLLVTIHELGHFMFAKLFKTRVEKFYLFFDPWFSIIKFKKGETEYGLGWIPFGGYVKISGMIDESMDKEQLKQEPQPYEFRSKTAGQRLLIMIGGVMMNVVMAICIYTGLSYAYGTSYIANSDVKDGYMFSETGLKMGFQNGDKILNIDGEEVESYIDIFKSVLFDDVEFVEVEREGAAKKVYIDKKYFPELLQKGNYLLEPRIPLLIDSLIDGKGAALAGVEKNDRIIAVDSVATPFFDQFKDKIGSSAASTVAITVKRGEKELTFDVAVAADSTIGIFPSSDLAESYKITTKKYTLLQSIPQGFKLAGLQIDNYIKQLKLIFSPETEAYKSVGSVVSMGGMFSPVWDWFRFWNITALLSIVLAVMNILPIPALDGGHVLFLLYEVITRRKPSDKFLEYAQTVGMILMFALMFFALGNDIYKLFQ